MKTINLYFDFEFTSLSPDSQPISLGVVSEDMKPCDFPNEYPKDELISFSDYKRKSFYAEFSDFDINRCDDWVREHVVSKLRTSPAYKVLHSDAEVKNATWGNNESVNCDGDADFITEQLFVWLTQFSDYQIQFVCDCGTYDWYWMLQLLAEWDNTENEQGFIGQCPTCSQEGILNYRTGLPKLPNNISPVPEDLNDLIAIKDGISAREAFDLNREELALSWYENQERMAANEFPGSKTKDLKHNALWDAKVIKEIYQKLK